MKMCNSADPSQVGYLIFMSPIPITSRPGSLKVGCENAVRVRVSIDVKTGFESKTYYSDSKMFIGSCSKRVLAYLRKTDRDLVFKACMVRSLVLGKLAEVRSVISPV